MKALLLTAILCSATLLSAATLRPNLTGTVVDADGNPVPDATVMVYHAGVKTGYSIFCPSCYIDCGKRVVTDAKGTFEIKDLAPDLWFTLLAARDGYVPKITKSTDPVKNPTISLRLTAKPPTTDFSGVVRGRVIEQDGSPVRDALITPIGLITGQSSTYGTVEGLQLIATTNRQGEFELAYNKSTPKMLLSVEARALAPKVLIMETGSERHTVTLSDGATVTGRLMANGKPIPNAQIALAPVHRGMYGDKLKVFGDPYDEIRIGTAADGRFTIPNVPGPIDWYVYAKMDSISSIGASSPIEVKVTRDGQYLQTADLVVKPGYRVTGTVIVSDNKPIPEGMHVSISSTIVSDAQTTPLASDGHFVFANLPPGKYILWASVKGYHEKTPQYGPTPISVDRDVNGFTTTVYPNP